MKNSIYFLSFLFFFLSYIFDTKGQNQINQSNVEINKLSDSQLQKIIQELNARGLTLEQAADFARSQGASQNQIDLLLKRIKGQGNTAKDSIQDKETVDNVTNTAEKKLSTKTKFVITEKNKKIFGYQLFNSEHLSFEPSINIAVSPDYVFGIGDKIAINVWGASQTNYQLTINRNGSIIIPDLGPVFLSGISFEKGQNLIKSRLASIYNGMTGTSPTTWAEVSLGEVRSIKINVIGEINAPGTYTLPSTSSAFNALYLSGGPNENGSFREIKLIRDGVNYKLIDVYDFLIKGDPTANIQLRDQDIILVPAFNSRVELDGQVKRKGLYETKEGESLGNVLDFAGGFGEKAYSQSVSIIRNNEKEREVRTVGSENFKTFVLKNGDYIKVDSILSRYSNRVSITGAVFHPGNYELTDGMKLSDLIKKTDGLREDAFLNRVIITRLREDRTLESISVDLKEVINGKGDVLLHKEDKIRINSIQEMKDEKKVEINGEVIKPATFNYLENMTLGDIIFMAGGFKDGADLSGIEVTRRLSYEQASKVTDQMNEIFQFTISRDLKISEKDASFKLEPFDVIFVRKAPGYRDQGTFLINGEVTYTGNYAISNKNERISDAIKRAGGLTPGAYINGATLTRNMNLSAAEIERKKHLMKIDTTLKDTLLIEAKTYPVGIELNKILENPGSNIDLLLQSGDVINIPRELQTVKVSGSVMNPIALTYQKKLSFRNYISLAGGFSDLAKESKAYVIYPNGNTATTHGFIFKRNPKLTPGAEIIVPQRPDRKNNDNALKWASMASALSTLLIALTTLSKL